MKTELRLATNAKTLKRVFVFSPVRSQQDSPHHDD